MDFKTIETVTLESSETTAWEKGKYNLENGYPAAVPVADDEVRAEIEKLTKGHGTGSPLYEDGKIKVPYLKPRYLPDGLLNNRFARTRLELQAIGILTNPQDKRYLRFKADPMILCSKHSYPEDYSPFCLAFKMLPFIFPFLWVTKN